MELPTPVKSWSRKRWSAQRISSTAGDVTCQNLEFDVARQPARSHQRLQQTLTGRFRNSFYERTDEFELAFLTGKELK